MFASKYYDWSLNYKILEGWILLVVSEGPLEIGTVDAFEVSELFSQQLQWCSIWYKYRNGDCGIISWRLNLMDMGDREHSQEKQEREENEWFIFFYHDGTPSRTRSWDPPHIEKENLQTC